MRTGDTNHIFHLNSSEKIRATKEKVENGKVWNYRVHFEIKPSLTQLRNSSSLFFAQGNVLKAKFSDLDVDKDGHITESDLQKVKRAYSALGRRQKAKLY